MKDTYVVVHIGGDMTSNYCDVYGDYSYEEALETLNELVDEHYPESSSPTQDETHYVPDIATDDQIIIVSKQEKHDAFRDLG